jgi:hypothetical protein
MKTMVITLLLLTVTLTVSLFGQLTPVNVVSDLTTSTEGNLNNAISDVINADPTGAQLSNTVFNLEPYGYYILTATITTPPHSHLHIVGPDPGTTQETALPQIVWTTSGGVTTTFNFDCYGDLSMKNVWIMCATTSGTQAGSSIAIEDDSIANLNGVGEHLWMDGCIIDYKGIGNGGGAIEPSCRHFRGSIKNSYFRNMIDPHYRYYGRAVSWTYQSTTWHTDTIAFENCTFANVGYGYMQESPEYGDHVSFNHCTFVNTMMHGLESNYWWWLSVTNSLFVNTFMFGWTPVGDASNGFGVGGYVNIDSISTFGFGVPFSDSSTAPAAMQRHILVANNSYGHEQWYTDFLASNPYMPDGDSVRVHRMPALSGKTYRFFTGTTGGIKNFPYMTHANNYPEVDTTLEWPPAYNAAVDPGFISNPENIDSIKTFLLGRWQTGADANWAYDITSDIQQLWPLSEDLSYTNNTLKTAAMGGFPLGDLFHWWPAKYTEWQAQATQENINIENALTTGTLYGVDKQHQSTIPLNYELGQNYPNPFNPTTNINFQLPVRSNVRLVLMNTLGQEVKVIASGNYEAGNHSVVLDATSLASGVYFYRLQTAKFSDAKKMVIIK